MGTLDYYDTDFQLKKYEKKKKYIKNATAKAKKDRDERINKKRFIERNSTLREITLIQTQRF
jgi:hypothetical protein